MKMDRPKCEDIYYPPSEYQGSILQQLKLVLWLIVVLYATAVSNANFNILKTLVTNSVQKSSYSSYEINQLV